MASETSSQIAVCGSEGAAGPPPPLTSTQAYRGGEAKARQAEGSGESLQAGLLAGTASHTWAAYLCLFPVLYSFLASETESQDDC